MLNWITGERLTFLVGFPVAITGMLFLSAMLGMKWQGAWLGSSLNKMLNRRSRFLRLIMAGVVGAVTPFCSCTTIPGFAAILEFKLGLDTAMAFLIASPLIDPAGTLLLFYLFGARLTLIYTLGSFIAAITGGWLLGKLFSEREINPLLHFGFADGEEDISWSQSAIRAWRYIKKFWWAVFLSCLAGFVLYDYVPSRVIGSLSGTSAFLAVPLASVLGLFVYAHIAVLLPAGAALLAKGMAPGVVLAFIASSAGISPPEIVLLRRILSARLVVSYVAVTVSLITLMGLVVNAVGR